MFEKSIGADRQTSRQGHICITSVLHLHEPGFFELELSGFVIIDDGDSGYAGISDARLSFGVFQNDVEFSIGFVLAVVYDRNSDRFTELRFLWL